MAAMIDYLGDVMNPIAVKEMRQAVKGRVLVWMLILYLLAQLVIMGAGILFSEFDGGNFNAGPELLSILLIALLLTCLLFLPAIFGLRLSAERAQNRIDLLFITDMSPYSIIWGKMAAAMALTGLLFFTAMPFLTLTYLLRGIDLPSIFVMLALDFVFVVLVIQGALLLACFPGGMISRGIRFLLGLGGAVTVFFIVSSLSFRMLQSGVGSLLGSWEFWAPALTVMGLLGMAMGFLYVLSAVLISPNSSNRAPVIRLYLFATWCCSTAMTWLWFKKAGDRELLYVWIIFMVGLFSTVFIIALCERTVIGPRVRRMIPRRQWLRIPAFFLYSGAASGVLFSLSMLALSLGFFYAVSVLVPHVSTKWSGRFHMGILVFTLYLVCYALTSLFVRRVLLPKAENYNSSTIMILFILLAAGSLFPFLFAWFFLHHDMDRIPDMWYLGNPLIVFLEPRMLGTALHFTIVWGLAAIALNIPWLAAQVRAFKPLEDISDIAVEPASAVREEPCPL
jgi:hypothetical protein